MDDTKIKELNRASRWCEANRVVESDFIEVVLSNAPSKPAISVHVLEQWSAMASWN